MRNTLVVARKEIRDHARDGRSLASTAMFALMGPAVVMLVTFSRVGADTGRPEVLLSMASVFTLVAAFTGGMNIAMDSMAGERERRSLIPLLLNAVPRLDVVLGKWIAVSVFAVGALLLTVVAFTAVLAWASAPVMRQLAAPLAAWVLLGLIPLALFGAAVDLLVAQCSRTVKEAQSWLSMVVFGPMLVGMFMVFFPRFAGGWWSLAPIAGQQSFVARAIAGQPVSVPQVIGVAAVTLALAAPTLLAARRRLNRDDLLAG